MPTSPTRPRPFDSGTAAPLSTLLAVDQGNHAVEVEVPQQPAAITPVAALVDVPLSHPTRSRTGGGLRFAALSPDGHRLLVTDDNSRAQVVLTGRRTILTPPSIDATGTT